MTENRHHFLSYRNGNYVYYESNRSCLPIYAITIVRLDHYHFRFLDEVEGDANISIVMKSGYTIFG